MKLKSFMIILLIALISVIIANKAYCFTGSVYLHNGDVISISDFYSALSNGNYKCEQASFYYENTFIMFDHLEKIEFNNNNIIDIFLKNGSIFRNIEFFGFSIKYNYNGNEIFEQSLDGIVLNGRKYNFNSIKKIEFGSKNRSPRFHIKSKIRIRGIDSNDKEIILSDIPVEIYENNDGRKGNMVFSEISNRDGEIKFDSDDLSNGNYIIQINHSDNHLFHWDKGSLGPLPVYIQHPFNEKYTIMIE